ncbi:MAG: membrane protein [Phycisphaerae bacterium]
MLMTHGWLLIGAVNGFLAVAAGAFGAHGLKSRVSAELLVVFETAARYQMYHALALLAVGRAAAQGPSWAAAAAGWCFLVGVVLFCGSLYVMTFTGARWLGAITPFGGTAMLIGWALLAAAAWRTSAARGSALPLAP